MSWRADKYQRNDDINNPKLNVIPFRQWLSRAMLMRRHYLSREDTIRMHFLMCLHALGADAIPPPRMLA